MPLPPSHVPLITVKRRQRLIDRVAAIITTSAVLVAIGARAWLGDDAFITLRTIDNFVEGHGLRWNVAERVQAFTHPLWLGVLAVPYTVTHEAFLTTIATSLLISGAAIFMSRGVAGHEPGAMALVGIAALGSRAFIDYGTSGLENPLSHLLITLLCAEAWREQPRPHRAGLITACLGLTRLDLLLIAIPLCIGVLCRPGRLHHLRPFLTGLWPLAAWTAFSTAYYGVPVPNTAYAKLATGIPASDLARQGVTYLLESFSRDPSTLAAVALGIVAPWISGPAFLRPPSIALALALGYVVSIGGDFMSGRFLTAPFWLAVLILARATLQSWRLRWTVIALLTALSVTRPRLANRPALSGQRRASPYSSIRNRRRAEILSGDIRASNGSRCALVRWMARSRGQADALPRGRPLRPAG